MTRKRLLPLYVSEFLDRHRKPRLRFRRQGHPTYYFKSPFGTEGFRVEYRQCLDGRPPVGADRLVPGSIDDLVARYYRSQDFLNGGDTTREKNRGILEGFRKQHGGKGAASIQFEHIDAILATKADKHPAAARNLRKQLRRLFAFAVKCRLRDDNPVNDTARIKGPDSWGHRPWSEDDVRQYQAHHKLGSMARLALELILWTGNRRSDALQVGRQHIKDGAFRFRQQKTGKEMVIPIAPELAKAIMAMPPSPHLTFLVTAYGKPFTVDGFGGRMRKWCDAAGLIGLSAHGLRKTMANRLALAGAGNQGIKSVTGHSGDSEVAHYTRGVDQERMARDTMAALIKWEMANRRNGLAINNVGGAE